MRIDENISFDTEQKETIQCAKDLCYNKKVIRKLEEAKPSRELSNIMYDARKGLIK